ncbi:helix-turn-helix transcriptional regulator [Chryseobacterium sp. RP-3-3]|uniref:Helix-turn-helix transcriptional regulator n=1 Tax=Chryseobacterium antibioticum TaxID=2728847 RepID=A0A7Y0ANU1_9FLAO|nr:AraC family transcriptional regulator [Chryseobacterium antibioticum]NML70761.1 helix-turn-helix transcriptional regulator [Chryseobacterium antibioticum]
MMKTKFLFLLILFSRALLAQNNEIDSLKNYSFSDLETKYYEYNSIDRIKDANLISYYYLQKAKREKNNEKIVEGYVLMHFNEPYSSALKYLDSVQSFTGNSKKNTYPARIYLLRGNIYFRYDHQKEALNNYILGLKYAKEKGNKRQIAFAEISIAYLNNYIGKHYEAVKKLKYYLYNAPYLSESELADIHLNLTSTYLDIQKMDSAKVLIREGLQLSKNNNIYRYNQYLSIFGLYNLKLKNYQIAIDNLKQSKKYFIDAQSDALSINYATLYLGQSYAGLGQKEKAVKNFIAIDSTVQKTHNTFPELREVYPYLIEYYKEKNDKEKQLYYIDRFLKIDKQLDSRFRYISRELPRRYDTPNLINEKAKIISELENRKIVLYFSICILILILFLVLYLYYKSEKKNKKIAQELVQSVYNKVDVLIIKDEFDDISSNLMQFENTEPKIIRLTSEDIAQNILKELNSFEAKELFLQKGITLNNVAKRVKTNTRYLSEIINIYKGKNFATYLNDLRIDYAIKKLAKDKKFRSYKLSAIAEELGYNNEQAFALAFKKKTGTPLTVYIKEIDRSQE